MSAGPEAPPDDIETLQAALIVARAEVAIVRAQQSDDQALIAHLKLQIEKLNRDRYGPRSERTGSARVDAGGTGEFGDGGRTRGRNGRSQNHEGGVVHAQAAVPQTVPGASGARAGDRAGTDGLQLLRRVAAVQAGRGHHRDAGGGPEILESDPARPG